MLAAPPITQRQVQVWFPGGTVSFPGCYSACGRLARGKLSRGRGFGCNNGYHSGLMLFLTRRLIFTKLEFGGGFLYSLAPPRLGAVHSRGHRAAFSPSDLSELIAATDLPIHEGHIPPSHPL